MKRMEDRADVESAQSEGEGPGFSSMSPDRRTNKKEERNCRSEGSVSE